jgi:hypothetical protein
VTDWPDWTGKAVAIIASGPSTKQAGVDRLKDRLPVLAIKTNVEIAPWAEVVYGCDFPWWRAANGLPDFRGLKAAYDPRACDQFGCARVLIPDKLGNRLLFDEVGTVGAGGNSGFQALNLAAQFGADRILLIGFDCHDRRGVHWYGRNTGYQMSNPDEDNFRRWRTAFDGAAKTLAERGVDVVNASAISDLKGFRRGSVADTLTEWGIREPIHLHRLGPARGRGLRRGDAFADPPPQRVHPDPRPGDA